MVLKELKKKYPNRKVNFKEYDDDGILYDQYGFNSQGFSPIQPGLFGVSQAWGGGGFPPPLSNSGLDYGIKTKLCTNIPHISTINLKCSEL